MITNQTYYCGPLRADPEQGRGTNASCQLSWITGISVARGGKVRGGKVLWYSSPRVLPRGDPSETGRRSWHQNGHG
eukprot:13613296-Heterocapsa_arctica.AAC.1